MKITLSHEKTSSNDVSIMVDTLRASTTITLGLSNFDKIIPCFTKEEAFELAKKTNGILAGEREGVPIEGFDIGNSPEKVANYKIPEGNPKTLILTTSNGTRILKDMNSKVLIGTFVNSKAVAKASINIADNEIDVVMAGYKGSFTIEDYLGAGEILYWIKEELNKKNIEYDLSDFAMSAILGSRNQDYVKKAVYAGNSGKKLKKLNSEEDIDICLKNNITENVAIYKEGYLKLLH